MKTLIKNATLVNENELQVADLLIEGERISRIGSNLNPKGDYQVIDATGKYLLPGVIDDQVHFREPGLTHKATIATESRAAVAGGVTTFFEQPNTVPQTVTLERLEEKFAIAQKSSFANYSFFLGGTNDNLEELKRLDPKACAGVKLFLGSSTGNMLVDDEKTIEAIFSNVDFPQPLFPTTPRISPEFRENERSYKICLFSYEIFIFSNFKSSFIIRLPDTC